MRLRTELAATLEPETMKPQISNWTRHRRHQGGVSFILRFSLTKEMTQTSLEQPQPTPCKNQKKTYAPCGQRYEFYNGVLFIFCNALLYWFVSADIHFNLFTTLSGIGSLVFLRRIGWVVLRLSCIDITVVIMSDTGVGQTKNVKSGLPDP